ncbi:MAG: hypothetical protein HFP81_07645 [Methylococcales symbiont of Hymedesmia sp. n. MRB-2018]|nr:MAG: hypothetical protein HFP78_07900 [Methylococcales symbiont of Hymedesmia sp. n. MRB-2018]KAF3983391.1 MAG: hypothetical protein HFP81_07645 [Methylococcales symbiont of Hymedesmia sp. n. MRB-2018]
MAEESSNYNKIVAGVAIVSISLILVLKDRETEHWERSNTTLEENATALQGVTRYQNIMTE